MLSQQLASMAQTVIDRPRLESVLGRLLSHQRYHSSPGSELKIRAWQQRERFYFLLESHAWDHELVLQKIKSSIEVEGGTFSVESCKAGVTRLSFWLPMTALLAA
ncbi:MAG: hypothetical protein Q9N68_12015 [Gammaproteobacteria bacterium]|nr:hypothetical protein [Gammaproteobacteria bacterium]